MTRPVQPSAGGPDWNARYATGEYIFGRTANDFLVEAMPRLRELSPGDQVLCLADGEGRNGVYLAEQGFAVTSVDGAENASRKARDLAAERGVRLTTEVADLRTYEFGIARWDAVVSIFFHMPSALRHLLHRRLVPALRPGGLILLEAYTPRQLEYRTGGPQVADNLMTLEALRQDFVEFEVLIGREVDRRVVEGSAHTGQAAVVQWLARLPLARAGSA